MMIASQQHSVMSDSAATQVVDPSLTNSLQSHQNQIEELKQQLYECNSILSTYSSEVTRLKLDNEELIIENYELKHSLEIININNYEVERSLEEINNENDELVNDIQDVIGENHELLLMLKEYRESNCLLISENLALVQEIDDLSEQLELSQEHGIDQEDFSNILEWIRQETKKKIEEAACQRQDLQLTVKMLSSENDNMEEIIRGLILERNEMEREMDSTYDLVNKMTRKSNVLHTNNYHLNNIYLSKVSVAKENHQENIEIEGSRRLGSLPQHVLGLSPPTSMKKQSEPDLRKRQKNGMHEKEDEAECITRKKSVRLGLIAQAIPKGWTAPGPWRTKSRSENTSEARTADRKSV